MTIGQRHQATARKIRTRAVTVGLALCAAYLLPLGGPSRANAQSPQPEDLPLTFKPFHTTGLYTTGETVGWTVTPKTPGDVTPYLYTARRNNQTVVQSGRLDLTTGFGTIKVPAKEPEMLLIEVTRDTGNTVSKSPQPKTLLGAAVSPTDLTPSVPRPADFIPFWHDKLAQLANIPIHAQLTPVASPKPGADLYTVTLDSLGSHVHGYFAKPKQPGKHPALLVFQWAGVYKLDPGVASGYANDGWLTFNVDSHDMEPTDDKSVSSDYAKIGDNDRDHSYFLDMFLRDTRAVDFLSQMPEWDGKTIVLTGVSMGGWQSLATAGLNPGRITDVIVLEPAGFDTNGDLHGRKTGYPYWPSNDPAVMRTALYFDPVNFAPEVKATTIMAAGFVDTTAPPTGIYTAFNLIAAPKQFIPLVNAGHHDAHPAETQAAYTIRLKEALDTILRTGTLTLP